MSQITYKVGDVMFFINRCLMITIVIFLNACASSGDRLAHLPDVSNEDIFIEPIIDSRSNGSIYGSPNNILLYEDSKASRIGDVLTIYLVEETNASKSASTSTVKDNNLNVANPTLLGSALSMSIPGFLPLGGRTVGLDSTLSSSKSFTGEGDSEQSNKMNGTITALVTNVLSNGNIVVSGKKRITINNGDEYIHITGVVRPRDISANNTVNSSKIANAEISYSGTGVVSDVNESGWLTRFFNSKWWPF